jgi:hypothetical protein
MPAGAHEVRRRIVRALRSGALERAPRPSRWAVLTERRSDVRADESDAAARLSEHGRDTPTP